MGAIKRGSASAEVKQRKPNANKKPKTETRKPTRRKDLETETDSDPIIESDTTEHSGDDDGVDWPSEGERMEEDGFEEDERGEDDGGVDLPIRKSHASSQPITKSNQPEKGSSSREAHAKQKQLAQERKAAKPSADSIARAKKLWERLRRQSHVPLEERKKLVAELFEIITGRVKEFVLKHDATRVVQTALKYGNLEQRKMIARELKGEFKQLAESRFAKFTIAKVLIHGDDEIRDTVVPEFFGHVRRLIKHPEAAWILDDIYRGAATEKQKAVLLREWYGAEYAIFKGGAIDGMDTDLATLLAAKPEKKAPIMRYLYGMINHLVQKQTTGFTMLHDAMLQYYLNIAPGSEEAGEFVELLKGDEQGDLLKNLAFTNSGSRLVSLVLAHSSAKDRKNLFKAYKGIAQQLAYDAYGHRVLLTALAVIDDTVLTTKSIYGELLPKISATTISTTTTTTPNPEVSLSTLLASALDLHARIPLLYPLAPKPSTILPTPSLALLTDVERIRASTSKKQPATRCIELARALTPSLLALIATHAATLIQSTFGCVFVAETFLSAEAATTADLVEARKPALRAVVALVDARDEAVRKAMRAPAAGRLLKALALSGRFSREKGEVELCTPPLGFADMLVESLGGARVVEWAGGENSFVVVGLLESRDFRGKEALRGFLKGERDALERAAAGGDGGEGEKGKIKDGKRDKPAGNKGTQLILRMLDEP